MNIPENLKIGGKVYNVEITENLKMGLDYTGEIDYCDLKINLRLQAKEKQEADLLHEMFYDIFDFCGYSEHNEELSDRHCKCVTSNN